MGAVALIFVTPPHSLELGVDALGATLRLMGSHMCSSATTRKQPKAVGSCLISGSMSSSHVS